MARLDANLSETQEFGSYQPVPPGEYEVEIINSDIKQTRSGENQVVFIYEIANGDYRGMQVFDRLSLFSMDPRVKEMSQRKLKTIAISCGLPNPNYVADTAEFHGRHMITKLAIREYNGNQYQDVKSYSPLNSSNRTPAAPRAATPPQQQAAAQSVNVHSMKPWE